jgi:acyl-coenzyme A thioesterase PaaI-like protein
MIHEHSGQMEHGLQPNSRMCFVCGIENPVGLRLRTYEITPGEVEATFTAPEHFQGYPGVLHGGLVASLLDELCGRALMGTDPASTRFMFTAKMDVKYRRHVPTGVPLRIVGRAGKTKARTAEAWAGIYHGQSGDLLAEATALLINVAPELFDMSQLETLGWQIYPE